MYTSFYTAARGVIEQQKRFDVVANNMANVNNYGYKSKNATFTELMHYNLNNANGEDTTIKAGTGVLMTKTNTDFSPTAQCLRQTVRMTSQLWTKVFLCCRIPKMGRSLIRETDVSACRSTETSFIL